MKLRHFLTLIALSSSLVFSNEEEKAEIDLATLRKNLASEEFSVRTEATQALWEKGTPILDLLYEIAAGDDPEQAKRADDIARKIRLGITPDTPPEIVALIEQFMDADDRGRVNILKQLEAAKEYRVILRLQNEEKNLLVLEVAREITNGAIPRIVRESLSEGRTGDALAILALTTEFNFMIQYAHLLEVEGLLESTIETLRNSKQEKDKARYLACLRVKGDAALLRKEARRLADRPAEVLAAFAMGDHTLFFEDMMRIADLAEADRLYLEWSLATHRGDAENARKSLSALKHLTTVSEGPEVAVSRLLIAGHTPKNFLDPKSTSREELVDYYGDHDLYFDALSALSLPRPRVDDATFDKWLEDLIAEKRYEQPQRRGMISPLRITLQSAAIFLELRGEIDQAVKCLEAYCREHRPGANTSLEAELALVIVPNRHAGMITLAKLAEEKDVDPAITINYFADRPRGSKYTSWIYARTREILPDLSLEKTLLFVASTSAPRLYVDEDFFEDTWKKLVDSALNGPTVAADLEKLKDSAWERGDQEDLLQITDLLGEEQLDEGESEEALPNDLAYLRGRLARDSFDFEKGVEFFEEMELSETTTYPWVFLQYALLQEKMGKPEAEENFKKAELYSVGDPKTLISFSNQFLKLNRKRESNEVLRKSLLRFENLQELTTSSNSGFDLNPNGQALLSTLIHSLSKASREAGDWKKLIALSEVSAWLLDLSGDTRDFAIYGSRARFDILLARGSQAMSKDQVVPAVRYFSEAFELLPRDGYLANDLFPTLRRLGLSELHDQFYARSIRQWRALIERFPNDDNARNNFAWLSSRANRNLDEAEEHLKVALKLRPRSEAYLDTMAEVYFARRDRETAVKWSTKSLANEISGASSSEIELIGQYYRFKEGEFPTP